MQKVRSKSEFDELIEKIRECIAWYDEKDFNDRVYNLILDNGEKINITFNEGSIAHLLGIDTECLKAKGLFNESSYKILKQVCNDSYRIYNMVNRGSLKYDDFISDFVYEKVRGFRNICGIALYDIEFICKYSKDNSYITGYPQLEGDYYIAYRGENGLFVLGLKKNGNYYQPMTNRYIDFRDENSKKFLSHLLNKQIITMPTLSSIYYTKTSYRSRTLYLDYNEKPAKIRTLELYSNNYGAMIDVSNGYKFLCEKLIQKLELNSSLSPILEKIFSYITRRVPINITELEADFGILPENIIQLIDSYNNAIGTSINAAVDEYTRSVTEERNRLIEENRRQIKELEELRRELLERKTLIENLRQENEQYQERENAIKRVLKINYPQEDL